MKTESEDLSCILAYNSFSFGRSIVGDMTMYIIVASRRSFASAVQVRVTTYARYFLHLKFDELFRAFSHKIKPLAFTKFLISPQILVSHALGDAFSPFLVGVLSDWIRPALKPLDSAVPVVTVSANVLPYGAPIFNNADSDMVILQPQSCLELFILPDTLRDNLYSLSISQQVRDLTPQEYDIEFRSLQYALFSSCFFQVL